MPSLVDKSPSKLDYVSKTFTCLAGMLSYPIAIPAEDAPISFNSLTAASMSSAGKAAIYVLAPFCTSAYAGKVSYFHRVGEFLRPLQS